MKVLTSLTLFLFSSIYLPAQTNWEGGSFGLRLATTLSPKNNIQPADVAPSGVDYYSKNTPGYEIALSYRLTKSWYRFSAGLKTGGYPIDKSLHLQAEISPAGYDYRSRAILFQPYAGLETSLEIRFWRQKRFSVFVGPVVQLLYSPSSNFQFDDGFFDENQNLRYFYKSTDLLLNSPARPYFGWGGRLSIETPIAKRLGLGLSLGYLHSKRDLLDSGSYTIYTVDGTLQGTLSKPFRYLFLGVELSLPRKRK